MENGDIESEEENVVSDSLSTEEEHELILAKGNMLVAKRSLSVQSKSKKKSRRRTCFIQGSMIKTKYAASSLMEKVVPM